MRWSNWPSNVWMLGISLARRSSLHRQWLPEMPALLWSSPAISVKMATRCRRGRFISRLFSRDRLRPLMNMGISCWIWVRPGKLFGCLNTPWTMAMAIARSNLDTSENSRTIWMAQRKPTRQEFGLVTEPVRTISASYESRSKIMRPRCRRSVKPSISGYPSRMKTSLNFSANMAIRKTFSPPTGNVL